MASMPVLLVSGADGSRQVLVAGDESGYRRAFGDFVASWGEEAVWFDDQARILGSEGGVTMARWRAQWLGHSPVYALVVLVGGEPADIYLVDDVDMGKRAAVALERPNVRFELVPLEPLPPTESPDGDTLAGLPPIRITPRRFVRPEGPRSAFSETICPRCEDHPLYDEALFDVTFADGTRVCVACGTLATLRPRR